MIGLPILGAIVGSSSLLVAGSEIVTTRSPFGYAGTIALGMLGAFTLWRSGSAKAWKDTAQARDARIGDLERELSEIRSELAIPERIEGIVRVMAETAERQDARSAERVEYLATRMEGGFSELRRSLEKAQAPTRS